MKISKELKTGVIAIIAIAVMIWGYNYLKKQSLFENTRVYYSEFDNVQGLTPSSIVSINGFQVGNVSSIKFNAKKKGSFIVSFTLTSDFAFSDKSTIKIIPPVISGMGVAELTIIPNYEGKEAISGTYLNGSIQSGLLGSFGNKLDPLNTKLNQVLASADILINNFNNILDTKTQNNLKSTIEKLDITMTNFKNASKSFDILLVENKIKISSILDNTDKASKNLEGITAEFKTANLTGNLKNTMNKLDKSLTKFETILTKVEKGDGTIAKLLNDKNLYNNLESASKEMEELLHEFKEHPKRFVHFSLFGKKDKKGYVEKVK
ncbi:MAG: MlaD family protein [Flavobacteriaceae bacterium]|nr:MlaD family protein [Flavobacteriaceae bacterium]